MKRLEILLLICGILWLASLIFLIYSIGITILTLNIQPVTEAILIFIFVTLAEILLAVLND